MPTSQDSYKPVHLNASLALTMPVGIPINLVSQLDTGTHFALGGTLSKASPRPWLRHVDVTGVSRVLETLYRGMCCVSVIHTHSAVASITFLCTDVGMHIGDTYLP